MKRANIVPNAVAIFNEQSAKISNELIIAKNYNLSSIYTEHSKLANDIFAEQPELFDEFLKFTTHRMMGRLENSMISDSNHQTNQNKNRNIHQFNESIALYDILYDEHGSKIFDFIPESTIHRLSTDKFKTDFVKDLLNKGYKLTNTDTLISSIVKGDKELFDLALKAGSPVNHRKRERSPLYYNSLVVKDKNQEEIKKLNLYFWNQLVQHGANVNAFSGYEHFLILNASEHNKDKFVWLLENGANPDISWTDNMKKNHSLQSYLENNAAGLLPILDKFILKNQLITNHTKPAIKL